MKQELSYEEQAKRLIAILYDRAPEETQVEDLKLVEFAREERRVCADSFCKRSNCIIGHRQGNIRWKNQM